MRGTRFQRQHLLGKTLDTMMIKTGGAANATNLKSDPNVASVMVTIAAVDSEVIERAETVLGIEKSPAISEMISQAVSDRIAPMMVINQEDGSVTVKTAEGGLEVTAKIALDDSAVIVINPAASEMISQAVSDRIAVMMVINQEDGSAVIAKIAEDDSVVTAKIVEDDSVVTAKIVEGGSVVTAKIVEGGSAVTAKIVEDDSVVIVKDPAVSMTTKAVSAQTE